ncbi:MAG: hypothetical protein KUG78_17995 [Kangiellaceae bacterium]|nr:hypothetical protein [Kangiellaceae bacterium]
MNRSVCKSIGLLIGGLLFVISSAAGAEQLKPGLELDTLDMSHTANPAKNLITGGQPSLLDLSRLAEAGTKLIINLRGNGEFSEFDEKEAVEKLGMKYISIPVAGGSEINLDNAKQLDRALNNLTLPVLVHCASSNRVGGLLAYREFKLKQRSSSDALAFGKSAGMRSTSKVVKTLIAKNN